jgi:hypothetical protein
MYIGHISSAQCSSNFLISEADVKCIEFTPGPRSVIRDGQSEQFWGDSDTDYRTRIATYNRILVHESPPAEIHARL